jgi:hypothetical protein
MPETPERLANRLAEEGQKTQQFFVALSPDQWEKVLYTDGAQWTVYQVLAHFVVTETGIRSLMMEILAGNTGVAADFNINAYNERTILELDQVAPTDLLAMFDRERQATISWVNGLKVADLRMTGRHPWLGIAPLEEMIQLLYRHNQIHRRDIRKLLAGD